MKPSTQPPKSVPVLTEVVVLPKLAPVAEVDEFPPIPADPAYAQTAPAPFGGVDEPTFAAVKSAPQAAGPIEAPPLIDEARVAQRVLADLDKQLDLMFEHRLRETLAPVLARMTDSLVREMRNQLAANLREMVARAVSLELDRLQKR